MANGTIHWSHTNASGTYGWTFCLRLGSLAAIESDGYDIASDETISDPLKAMSILRHSIDAGSVADLSVLPKDELLEAANQLLIWSFPTHQPGDPS